MTHVDRREAVECARRMKSSQGERDYDRHETDVDAA
jgi:hypothetical protein